MDWLFETPWTLWVALALVFAVIEMLSLDLFFLMLRPPLLKKLNKSATGAVTNAEALVGAEVCVTQDVTSETGLVVLAGDTWTARTASGTLVAGSHARVRAIEGATAIVEPLPHD